MNLSFLNLEQRIPRAPAWSSILYLRFVAAAFDDDDDDDDDDEETALALRSIVSWSNCSSRTHAWPNCASASCLLPDVDDDDHRILAKAIRASPSLAMTLCNSATSLPYTVVVRWIALINISLASCWVTVFAPSSTDDDDDAAMSIPASSSEMTVRPRSLISSKARLAKVWMRAASL